MTDLEDIHCPYCQAERDKVTNLGGTTTLLGWTGGPEADPNHWVTVAKCTICDKKFYKHHVISQKAVWYVGAAGSPDKGKCLEGNPACCAELYELPCAEPGCGGWTKSRKGVYEYSSKGVGVFPEFRECLKCGHRDSK